MGNMTINTEPTEAKATNLAAGIATKQVTKARERFEDRVSQQRDHITGRVRTLGRALRGAGEMLEEDDMVGNALHYASDKVENVAGYVAELSPDRVAEDLRGVARKNPWWFFGGAFALGLALGRFARSTGEGSGTAHVARTGPRGGPNGRTSQARRPSARAREQRP